MGHAPARNQDGGLEFPDGRIVPSGVGSPSAAVQSLVAAYLPPTVDETARKTWLYYNYLLRPPLSDAEIKLMPNAEIVQLYYSLKVVVGCGGQYKANPVVSRGLPGPYAINHDRLVQGRIYNLRPDLHSVRDSAGQSFRVLLSPGEVDAPACDETAVAIQALSALLAVATLGAAWWVVAVTTAITATATNVNKAQMQNIIAKTKGVAKEVLSGIQVMRALSLDPVPDSGLLASLSTGNDQWQSTISQVIPVARGQMAAIWRHLPFPDMLIATNYPQSGPGMTDSSPYCVSVMHSQGHRVAPNGACLLEAFTNSFNRYLNDWTPYSRYFYSDSVTSIMRQYAATAPANLTGSGNLGGPGSLARTQAAIGNSFGR